MVAGLVSRKADAFAALLEGKGAAGDPAFTHMSELVQRLSNVPQPSAAFKASLRDQLVSAASQTATAAGHAATATSTLNGGAHGASSAGSAAGSAAGTGTTGLTSTMAALGKSAPLWFKLFTGVVAVGVSATGVGIGAHRALPGDLLYGVKRQVEAVQLDLASGKREEATTQLDFARARTKELQELLKRDHVTAANPATGDTAKHINGLLQDWAEEAGVATTSLLQQIQALGSSTTNAALSTQLRSILSTFTSQQFLQLGTILPQLPTGSLQSLTVSALGYLQRVDTVLGGNPQQLLQQLPVAPQVLQAIPGLSTAVPQVVQLPKSVVESLTKSGQVPLIKNGKLTLPGALSSLLPSGATSGALPTSGVLPTTGALPTNPVSGLIPTVGPSGLQLPQAGNLLPALGGVLPSTGTGTDTGSTPNVPQVITSAGDALSQTAGDTLNGVGSAVGGTIDGTVGTATKAAGGLVSGATQAAGGAVSQATKAAGGAVSQATKAAGDVVNPAGAPASGAADTIIGTVAGGLSSSSGPALPLPVVIPTLPALPPVSGLPGLH